jgi:hypothetical protein
MRSASSRCLNRHPADVRAVRSIKLNWQMFFSKQASCCWRPRRIPRKSLLFGSFAVKSARRVLRDPSMILLANLYVMMVKPTNLKLPYALLAWQL